MHGGAAPQHLMDYPPPLSSVPRGGGRENRYEGVRRTEESPYSHSGRLAEAQTMGNRRVLPSSDTRRPELDEPHFYPQYIPPAFQQNAAPPQSQRQVAPPFQFDRHAASAYSAPATFPSTTTSKTLLRGKEEKLGFRVDSSTKRGGKGQTVLHWTPRP